MFVQISHALVDAYRARRALDYLVGFTLSPLLWRKLPGARSAGMVERTEHLVLIGTYVMAVLSKCCGPSSSSSFSAALSCTATIGILRGHNQHPGWCLDTILSPKSVFFLLVVGYSVVAL